MPFRLRDRAWLTASTNLALLAGLLVASLLLASN
jgi:hypothetical protein